MRAVLCHEYGLPESLVIGELPDPQPGVNLVAVPCVIFNWYRA